MTTADLDQSTFEIEWQQWHDGHEKQRARPLGFLAITGLHWLSSTPERFDDVPGEWSSDANGVQVNLGANEELTFEGTALTGLHNFGQLAEASSLLATFGDNAVEITSRNGLDLIRPRRPDHDTRTNYRGTPSYPANPEWRVRAHFVASDELKLVRVDNTVEDLHHDLSSPGRAEFELQDQAIALTLFGSAEDELYVLFRDGTSGVTTYGACRTLDVAPPDADGFVVLDFNRATNLPCAYTTFTTCPLPPLENRLSVPIEAGELLPLDTDH